MTVSGERGPGREATAAPDTKVAFVVDVPFGGTETVVISPILRLVRGTSTPPFSTTCIGTVELSSA